MQWSEQLTVELPYSVVMLVQLSGCVVGGC